MTKNIVVDGRVISHEESCYVIGEIGINHNGSLEVAKELIKTAADAGCEAVKFQKRTPELCVPKDQWEMVRETPWGTMSYIEYRHKVEFEEHEYRAINEYCGEIGVTWFASPWDIPSVEFLEKLQVPCYKIASACLTDTDLLNEIRSTSKPVIMSTGMSNLDQIREAVSIFEGKPLALLHCNSAYPANPRELNLRVIGKYRDEFQIPIGYSGHESGLAPSLGAVALGACILERHITLDRAMWGTDQSASVEPQGIAKLIRDLRTIELSLGDGNKIVYDSELEAMKKLRRFQ